MGSYAALSINNFDFITCKNSIGDLTLFFSDSDYKEYKDNDGCTRLQYSTSVKRAKLALDTLGYTTKSMNKLFNEYIENDLELIAEYDDSSYEEIKAQFTFEEWRKAVIKYSRVLSKDTFDEETCNYVLIEIEKEKQNSWAERKVLKSLPFSFDEDYFGVPYYQDWHVFRIILDAFDDDDIVTLDYSDLYAGGWIEEKFQTTNNDCFDKTIILTEGKTDALILSESIKILYPYMSKFYSFIDFSDPKVQGSTNFLTHYVKVFIGAGIKNNIIALYDNDSAAINELRNLQSIKIPSNVKILTLPNVSLGESYPTIGPTSNECVNINGLATSIELFLGRDILSDNDGNLYPIMWTSYIKGINKYQGEITQKDLIQDKFFKKAKIINTDSVISDENWLEMDLLLNQIFGAFN